MSLSPKLLAEFDKSMIKAGFTDRSKAIQTALHSFVDEHNWVDDLPKSGAGAIIMLYDNHVYNQDTKSTRIQHKYNDIISAATHLHLNDILDLIIRLATFLPVNPPQEFGTTINTVSVLVCSCWFMLHVSQTHV
jgi:metal-responsive CopG/Arc/MetJ family transcriptional regulator